MLHAERRSDSPKVYTVSVLTNKKKEHMIEKTINLIISKRCDPKEISTFKLVVGNAVVS